MRATSRQALSYGVLSHAFTICIPSLRVHWFHRSCTRYAWATGLTTAGVNACRLGTLAHQAGSCQDAYACLSCSSCRQFKSLQRMSDAAEQDQHLKLDDACTLCCCCPLGNLETLLTTPTKAGIDVRAAVADWHARHYSANLMTAAVYGRHSLDELQRLVTHAFEGVANNGLQVPQFPSDLYTDEVRAPRSADADATVQSDGSNVHVKVDAPLRA
eukprot:GHRQ01027984.1.p1 GENE.GHRQ01027984.1~~GHRQ01027984.1.p1  ORF type:complete len:215 (+),score=52.22 GHRQ01027984.1:443-1087(+)